MKLLWTTLYVKDLEKSIEFYSDMAELKVENRFPAGPGMEIVFMGNGTKGETLVELIKDENRTADDYGESVSIGFAVDSVDTMLKKVQERGIPVHSGPVETPTKARFFVVKDPNGLNVQFFQQS